MPISLRAGWSPSILHPLVVLVLLGLTLATGCAGPTPTAGSIAPTPSAASSDQAAQGVIVLPKPWLPPWAGPNTPVEIAERAALRFCGVEGGPEIDVGVRSCFLDAVAAGRDIEFARVASSTEGDPIATVFGFEPDGGFVMLTDSTQDRFGVRAWTVAFCARLVNDRDTIFRLDECRTGPEYR